MEGWAIVVLKALEAEWNEAVVVRGVDGLSRLSALLCVLDVEAMLSFGRFIGDALERLLN